ncbi:RHS repeat-associated core domain-containing protein [Chitinophaga sp. S165]|uniref:RHS repeat-associated core domain-containing protein n=1 Tax=Chitinophaga sp. S165 TaxID=2135462 RepID=UPI000D9206C9|nr:RHS repeat-associated core domain-containing protein [Chitinophaga sp. S165]PWV55751.1 RHS repeat-associated protein [Chitinophaga sp. S165]
MSPFLLSLYNLSAPVMRRIVCLRVALTIVLLLMLTIAGHGQTVKTLKEFLDGKKGQIAKDSFVMVKDDIYFDASKINTLDTPYLVKNIITLKINEYAGVPLPQAFTAQVSVRIIYTRPDYQTDSIDRTLSINYADTSSYTSRSSFVFSNAHMVTAKILGVTTTGSSDVKSVLQLDNEMQVSPVYKLSCSNDAVKAFRSIQPVSPNNADELRVEWNGVTGADVYDLEWAYIDSSALKAQRYGNPLNPNKIFKNNASRVTVADNNYNIPLLYDGKGALYFRVRAVQERADNARTETNWSSDFGGLGAFAFNGHQDSLNWQATTSFAEEGKRKSVVQYYDGSLRGRQTVTKDNSTKTTIVGETYYDYQGRPAVQVLPSPTLNSIIKYSPGFNRGINSPEYDKGQYDTLPSPAAFLTAAAKPMSDKSGTNQYYSSGNPDTSGINKFIPDAEGYAFTETVYTQDNTGRISRQSGVGPVFRIGSTHETEYYYGSPGNGDLDALFGTDVGDKSHYFKNMVKDANGQFAVSYVDMHGRTIATALAGKPDSANLSDLTSYKEEHVIDSLSGAGSNIIKDLTLENTQSQLVTIKGDYDFKYQLKAPVVKINTCNGPVCFNGLYDLEIRITDDAYNQRLARGAFDTVFRNYNLDSIKAGCNIPPRDFNISFSINLPRGNYEITKRLTVNRQALEYYRDSVFMKMDTCVKLDDFIRQQRALLANEQCVPDCKSCKDSVGTWASFWAKYPARIGQPVQDSVLYKTQALADFNKAVEACGALCKDTSDVEDILAAMLMDVSAPSGQYADVNDTTSVYSIFYHKDETELAPYERDNVYYLDESGLPDQVYNDDIQAYVKPQRLSPAMFAAKFKSSWAAALLQFHPEYYKYQAYLQRQTAYEWDRKAEAIDTYAEAKSAGYLNPTGNSDYSFPIVPANNDPLASRDVLIKDKLNQVLKSYNKDADPAKQLSLWSVATMTVKCQDALTACKESYRTPDMAFSETNLCEGDRDMAWRTFRQLYLMARREILDGEVANIGAPAGVAMVSSAQLIAAGKSPRFNTASGGLSQAGLDFIRPDRTEKELSDYMSDALKKSYEENCNAYVTAWMQQLAPCKYDYNSNDWEQLKSKLLEVCKQGADIDHPMGASTVRPSSSYKYKSFQAVLEEYNVAHNINNPLVCNAYLITAPAPYDKQLAYADKASYTRPSDCECNQLSMLQKEYQLRKKTGDTNLAVYLNRTRGTSFTQAEIQALIDACSMVGTGCDYLSKPISIPVVMQCNSAASCASCTEVKAAYDSFQTTFPGISPQRTETDSLQQLKNQLFAAYMNSRLGFSKQAWEYLNFIIDTCAQNTIRDSTVCNPANPSYHTYSELYERNVIISDMVRTPDNGFVLAGSLKGRGITGGGGNARMFSDPVVFRDTVALLLKVDKYGVVQWAYNYLVGEGNYFSKLKTTQEGGFVAIGAVWGVGHDSSDIFIVKTDGDGNTEWSRKIGLNTSMGETGWDIIQTSDNGYAFAGRTNNNYVDSTGDWLIGALDSRGYGRWLRQLGNSNIDEAYSLMEDHDTLVVLGSTFLAHGVWHDYDVMIAKINKNTGVANQLFRYDFGSALGTSNNYPNIVQVTSYGYLFNVSNGLGNNFKNGIASVTKYGDIISSRQLSNPKDSMVAINMPMLGSANGEILAVQNVRTRPYGMVAFNKIGADSSVAWSDGISLDSTIYANDILENRDGSYTVGGTYGKFGLLIFTPVSGRLSCNNEVLKGTSSGLRVTQNQLGTFSTNIVRGADSAVSPLSVGIGEVTIYEAGLSCNGANNCYKIHGGPLLCGNANPIFSDVVDSSNNCSDNEYFAVSKGTELYNAYRDSLRTAFGNLYADSCIHAGQREGYTMGYDISEYHYTLYYYDQAGNLLKTVPPAGVIVNRSASWLQNVRSARAAGLSNTPAHTLATNYRYNTLSQVVAQNTPDAGTSRFWYDRLGRLAISQNLKQRSLAAYSYTQYDQLGRITEVGEISSSASMNNGISRNAVNLGNWFTNAYNSRTQITRTVYDVANSFLSGDVLTAVNLRNRISWTALYDSSPEQASGDYTTATFYSYDIHGNVNTLVQDYKKGSMRESGRNRWKKMVYSYDLISGKVNQVAYQPEEEDAFYHRYNYDAENRLTKVETSGDGVYWENDAFYQYYKHGPLARTVLGQQQVQGLDYAYTLQGWLKGVNSTAVGGQFDMGHDGTSVARDVFGFALHYYGDRDYKTLGNGPGPFASVNGSGLKPLFNGNISAISQSIPSVGSPLQYAYSYDALNRLKGMQASSGLDSLSNKWTPVQLPDYKEDISYDANGNILTYSRNGNKASANKQMDDLTYKYYPGTNRLEYVHDAIDSSAYSVDIDNQVGGNYTYDSIGNLVADVKEGISAIEWTLYGKIKTILKKDGTLIKYTYDVSGNRISKSVNGLETWYVRDAAGNVMGVYTKGDPGVNNGMLTKSETHLYGSSRLGVNSFSINVEDSASYESVYMPGLGSGLNINFTRGKKVFELSNHLGNVLATVSDKRWLQSGWYEADVRSAQEYYPFGMQMPGRGYNAGGYRYGFNGKENDNEVKGEGNQQDYGMRVYDPRLGKFLSVDPLGPKYPWNSSYAYAENDPVKFIDLDGLEKFDPAAKQPIGITYISKATLPLSGVIDEKHFIKVGNYRLHGVVSQDGKQWWLARKQVKGGYVDDYIVGTDAVGLFTRTRDKLDWAAGWVERSEGNGGGLWGAYKSTWTPQNVAAGIMIGMGGLIAAGEVSAAPTVKDAGIAGTRTAKTSNYTNYGGEGVDLAVAQSAETSEATGLIQHALQLKGRLGPDANFNFRVKFELGGWRYEVRSHGIDLDAAAKYPGSNSGSGPTWRIERKLVLPPGSKVQGSGTFELGASGTWYSKDALKAGGNAAANDTHIPLWNIGPNK